MSDPTGIILISAFVIAIGIMCCYRQIEIDLERAHKRANIAYSNAVVDAYTQKNI